MQTTVKILLFVFLIISTTTILFAQTTGKVSGVIFDEATGDPLQGANIFLVNTSLGAASGEDGSFYILNIPPGLYTIRVQMIGYEAFVLKNARISVNRTFEITAKLKQTVLEGKEVVVTAEKVQVKKDQTSSVRNVSADEIELLPVESLNRVINMQAGVINGHFRGGRNTEVSYLIDGIQVDDSFNGTSGAVNLETATVQDLEVITGTFNAEYGRAMSGVVNAVTKSGGNQFHGSISSSFANYFTGNNDVFIGLGEGDYLNRNLSQDYKFQLEGPILKNKLTFFTNYRFQNNNGHLNGIRRFNPRDYNNYPTDDPSTWHIEHTGDNEYVSMQEAIYHNFLGKLSLKPVNALKIEALFTYNDSENKNYNHYFKYIPDIGRRYFHTSYMGAIAVNHMLSPALFYDLKVSYIQNKNESYLYKDPLDDRYLHPKYLGTGIPGFATGGTGYESNSNYDLVGIGKPTDTFTDGGVKFDIYWQMNKNHSLKSGVLYTNHKIDRYRIDVRNVYDGLAFENDLVVNPETGKIDFPFYDLEIVPITDKTMNVYVVKPYEFSGYAQDKMEFDEMVINVGVRYDYFNSDQIYPTDRRNPANQLALPDSMMSTYVKAPAQTQLSPRFGLAYQLSDQAVLHISYGHFFQMPPMYALYANNIFRVPVNDYGTTMGNTLLKPQKTISYEIGIWQELTKGMGLELSLYYRDIYDLLSTRIISTYNQIEYGLYTNKDYGNARGLEVKWDFQFSRFFTSANYTLAYTRGNADNPMQTFTRAGNSMDPISRLIPMSWDQRHTFNVTVSYTSKNVGVTLTGYYNSGTPYTFAPLEISPLSLINLYENNAYKPSSYTFDLSSYWNIKLFGGYEGQITLNVYNIFDRKNANWVYADTGQPYTQIVFESQLANHRSDFNDYMDRIQNPTAYSAPRQVKIGFGVRF